MLPGMHPIVSLEEFPPERDELAISRMVQGFNA